MNYKAFLDRISFFNYYGLKYPLFIDKNNWVYNKKIGIFLTYQTEVRPILIKMVDFHNQDVLLGLNNSRDFWHDFKRLYDLATN